jgi:hypothetical protein
MAIQDWAPSFTLNELYEISDAVMPALRGYLESGDPEQHEVRFGSVSTLLEVVMKLHTAFGKHSGARPGHELPDWFPELEKQVQEFRERARQVAAQSAQAIGHFAWDRWKSEAIRRGVSEQHADLGRAVIRDGYQHGWECFGDESVGESMLIEVLDSPSKAAIRWQELLETEGGRRVVANA